MSKIHRSHNILTGIAIRLGLPMLVLEGCGDSALEFASQSAPLLDENGLSVNGLSVNGLSVNGLSVNGLSVNGLSTSSFQNWFESNPDILSDLAMKYVIRCALPAGQSRVFTSSTGASYRWDGKFGLAPSWASGTPATLIEQQLITSCLGAHVNKFGLNVPISVLGYDSSGAAIPMGRTELTDYPVREGCFFGNVFNGEGVFVGNDSVWRFYNSSSRDCALASRWFRVNNNCPPMIFAGACSDMCTPDPSNNAYLSCSYNGKSYAVINTRVTQDVIYRCGDHVCQISESCGTGFAPDNCMDCGPCN